MNAQEECVPSAKDIPFELYTEYVDTESGAFYQIGKVKTVHMLLSMNAQDDDFGKSLRLLQVLTKIEGRYMTDKEMLSMDMRLFLKLNSLVHEQLK